MSAEQFFTPETARITANIIRPIIFAIEILKYIAPAVIVIAIIVLLIKRNRKDGK